MLILVAESNEIKAERYSDPKYLIKAIDCYKEAFKIDKDLDILFNRARCHLMITDFEVDLSEKFKHLQESVKVANAIIKRNQSMADVYHHLGQTYSTMAELLNDLDAAYLNMKELPTIPELLKLAIDAFNNAMTLETDETEKIESIYAFCTCKSSYFPYLSDIEVLESFQEIIKTLPNPSSTDQLISKIEIITNFYSVALQRTPKLELLNECIAELLNLIAELQKLQQNAQIKCEIADLYAFIFENQLKIPNSFMDQDYNSMAIQEYNFALSIQFRKEIVHSIADCYFQKLLVDPKIVHECISALENCLLNDWLPMEKAKLLAKLWICHQKIGSEFTEKLNLLITLKRHMLFEHVLFLSLVSFAATQAPSCSAPYNFNCLATEAQFTILGNVTAVTSPVAPATNFNATINVLCAYGSFSKAISNIVSGGNSYLVTKFGWSDPSCPNGASVTVGEMRVFFVYISSNVVSGQLPTLTIFDICTGGFAPSQANLQIESNLLTQYGANALRTGPNCTLPAATVASGTGLYPGTSSTGGLTPFNAGSSFKPMWIVSALLLALPLTF